MDEIKTLLHRSGLSSLKDAGLTIVSLYGVSSEKRTDITSNTSTFTIANRIVGGNHFTAYNELAERTTELVEGVQMHVNHDTKVVYLYMDSYIDISAFAKEKSITTALMNHQSSCMRGLLLMLIVSHLVIPILPPSILPADFLSTLVALNQVKLNMYTHLAQFQSLCWKHWDIGVPNSLFEKKEMDRINPNFLGWWGPAKGVPMLVFVASNIQFTAIIPAAIKRMQEHIQVKTKNIFRALHLIPLKVENNMPNLPVEVKSLFLLPSGSQPVIHIVPAPLNEPEQPSKTSMFNFDAPLSLSSYLEQTQTNEQPTLCQEYSDKLLRNFVNIWTKAAVNRHPLHSNRKGGVPLPTVTQFCSSVVPLISFIFNQTITENGIDFKKVIGQSFPSTKGMIQQIEVSLRKKIRDNIEIERVFSKTHSADLMEKCNEAYLQDSPPFYTNQYHTWKKNNVMRMYRSLARGPCLEEYAVRLERECDNIWKQGRQSCEHVSLTGKACRLKIGHETETTVQKTGRDDRSIPVDNTKHNSGFNFFHACSCGQSQRIREDPFDIEEANITFYHKFDCCLGKDRAALDIKESIYGESQAVVLRNDEIPPYDSALLYLGPSSLYKNNVGLDKVEGFMSNTNFLVPWSITTVAELRVRQQEALTASENSLTNTNASTVKNTLQSSSEATVYSSTTEWPALGKEATPIKQVLTTNNVVSLEAFPALGSTAASTASMTTPAPSPSSGNNSNNGKQLFDTRRKRHHRARERIKGLIRGYVGAEYECPQGHRFLSCDDGKVCKLGHAGHPKDHGNHFVHQDFSIFVVCPCTFASNTNSVNNIEVIAQLQRLYIVTPDEALTVSIEPKVKLTIPGREEPLILDLGIIDDLALGPDGLYVLRLPFIYRDENNNPIPLENEIQKRLKSAALLKDCIKFHYKEPEKWLAIE